MNDGKILLAHGSGGQLGNDLIEKHFLPLIGNPILNKLNDQGIFEVNSQKFAFSTDSYVIYPIFFPGGNIGELAVNGTINDVAMCGATPLYISLSLIIEEGFPISDLEKILRSIKKAVEESNVQIITGDTKVVTKGNVDGIFINTAGVGVINGEANISADNLQVGDKIIVSGYIADHGIAILAIREGLIFDKPILSDTMSLNDLVYDMLNSGCDIHAMRDPTRGGLASTLNEFAKKSNVSISIEEDKLPIREQVSEACNILGINPLHVANEGKLVAVVNSKNSDKLLQTMKRHPKGEHASVIGEVTEIPEGKVTMKTKKGSNIIVDMIVGDQLPRIC